MENLGLSKETVSRWHCAILTLRAPYYFVPYVDSTTIDGARQKN